MKRAIAAIVMVLIAGWFINDAIQATKMTRQIFTIENAVSMYESRHGALETDQRQAYLDDIHWVCVVLDDNQTLSDIWTAMTNYNHSGDAAATTIEAAITYVCPEYKELLT